MGKIEVKNIRVYTNHGCLPEETKIGSDYRVDIKVNCDLTKSSKTDNLADTVDYVHLNTIVKEEMAIRAALLEEVAQRINTRVLTELHLVDKVKVKVAKLNPPIGGDVEEVSITLIEKR